MGNFFWLSSSFTAIFAATVALWARGELGKCEKAEAERDENRRPPAI